jgi:hypothetical protein
MRAARPACVLLLASLAFCSFAEVSEKEDKEKDKDKGKPKDVKMMFGTVSMIRLKGSHNPVPVPPKDVTMPVKDDNLEVDFVFVDLAGLDGFTAAGGFVKFYGSAAEANVELDPPIADGAPLMPDTGPTWKAKDVLLKKKDPLGTMAINNWVVVWGKFTKDDEFIHYRRFPKKGALPVGFAAETHR